MSEVTIDLLKKGIDANNTDPYRQGNVILLPNIGSLIVTGDLHGHRRNFERIVTFSDLANNPMRHLLLQEIIHGGQEDDQGGCMSFYLLFDAIRLKLEFPHQVHFIMGNHDTAFISDSEVTKGGKEMNASMKEAMNRCFKDNIEMIELGLKQFLFSQPLALKCANKIWISHSLPGNREVDRFDQTVLHRPLQITDMVRPNSAYTLMWGRKHNQQTLEKMAKLFDAELFILGHQAQPNGFSKYGDKLVIIASDHNHGCLVKIDLSKAYTLEALVESAVPIASIA